MPTVERPLDRACSLMAGACDQLTARDDYAAASALLRCHEVIALLEDCGGSGVESPWHHHNVDATLRAVASILDDIPEAQRPRRLGAARAELAGVVLALGEPPFTEN